MYVAFDSNGEVVALWHNPQDIPENLTLIELPEEIYDASRCEAVRDASGAIVGVNVLPPAPDPYAYRELRRAEYPPLADLADALVHQYMGDPVPLENYYKACVAVKQKYPKPTI